MVFYFKARPEAGDYTIFMGLDKYENEDLIKYGFPEDIWFHVDKMSSAHVYLRLPKGQTMDDIPEGVLEDCVQLVKANSIQGNKLNNIDVVYTPWQNLRKTASMEVGQVSFHNPKMVRTVRVEKRINEIVNRLNRTKVERKPDLKAEREAVSAAEKAERKQQLREKVSSSVPSGIPLPITNMNLLGNYTPTCQPYNWVVKLVTVSVGVTLYDYWPAPRGGESFIPREDPGLQLTRRQLIVYCFFVLVAGVVEGCWSRNKLNYIDVVYTPWQNLRKTASMEVGQLSERQSSAAEKAERKQQLRREMSPLVPSGYLTITNMNLLGYYRFSALHSWIIHSKSTSESLSVRIVYVVKRREEMERLEKERQTELRSYKNLMVAEKMTSNKNIASTGKSLQELEEDFM
nr:coiled-coil domain-containing protein 25 [Ipomoea batatas]